MPNSIYNFKIKSLQNQEINFNDFQDKVILGVNTASKCGFTSQYAGLQALYSEYVNQGLVIIGFPCNQFGGQEPGEAKDIQENCLVNYGVTFLITEKIDVNGQETTPVFKFLKESLPGMFGTEDIKWNFTKFLIDRNGKAFKRFAPATEPTELRTDIEALLSL